MSNMRIKSKSECVKYSSHATIILCTTLKRSGSRWNQELTAVVLHVRPDVPLLQAVSKGAVPNIVALLLLHHMHTHLDETQGRKE